MSVQTQTIHDYLNPPVIETVLSVQFIPIHGFSIPHVGLYHETIRKEFKRYEAKPPLGHIQEVFSPKVGVREQTLSFSISAEPPFRAWFLDEKGNQIIQIQKDRFIYNWQKVAGDETYPRYQSVRSKFQTEWERFRSFLNKQSLSQPDINQCEVTYVNHIEYEKGWKGYGELSKVIAPWSGKHSGNFLPSPENINLNVTYRLKDNQGRLHMDMQPVLRARDAKEVLQLNLTARIVPSSSNAEDAVKWLDLGRLWIVEGFDNVTTPEIRKVWGQTK